MSTRSTPKSRIRCRPLKSAKAILKEGFDVYCQYQKDLPFVGTRKLEDIRPGEGGWWRCHRALIADALCVRGIEEVHILDAKDTVAHPYTSRTHSRRRREFQTVWRRQCARCASGANDGRKV